MSQKITVFAMGQKGFTSLQQLINHYGAEIFDKVIYASDKAVINDYSAEIIDLCKTAGVPFYNRTDAFSIETQYSIAISWRWLINVEPDKRIIVFHDSILPKYRGFAPLVSALINGDKEIGVTALFATKEFDRGEIIGQKRTSISYPIKVKDAIEILSGLYGQLSLDILGLIRAGGAIKSSVQNEKEATYSIWRNDNDYAIDWSEDAITIARFIDAVGYPFMGASSQMDNAKVRILDSEALEDIIVEQRERHLGKVLFVENGQPVVICGAGLLRIKEIIHDTDRQSVLPLKKFRTKFR